MDNLVIIALKATKEIEIAEVAMSFKKEVESFKSMLSVLISLKDKRLEKKQWKLIKALVIKDKSEKELSEMGIKKAQDLFEKLDNT